MAAVFILAVGTFAAPLPTVFTTVRIRLARAQSSHAGLSVEIDLSRSMIAAHVLVLNRGRSHSMTSNYVSFHPCKSSDIHSQVASYVYCINPHCRFCHNSQLWILTKSQRFKACTVCSDFRILAQSSEDECFVFCRMSGIYTDCQSVLCPVSSFALTVSFGLHALIAVQGNSITIDTTALF